MEEARYEEGAECEIDRPEQPALIDIPPTLSFVCRHSCKPQLL